MIILQNVIFLIVLFTCWLGIYKSLRMIRSRWVCRAGKVLAVLFILAETAIFLLFLSDMP